jgi:hypothetical protein
LNKCISKTMCQTTTNQSTTKKNLQIYVKFKSFINVL